MFTGLVEHTGCVSGVRTHSAGRRLVVDTGAWPPRPTPGDSIAVDGVCLTVVEAGATQLSFDVVPQTLSVTTLGAAEPGRRVNLERAATVATLLGGHLVQGHVDGTVSVRSVSDAAGEWRVRFDAPSEAAHLLLPQGSVALDGVSLTVAATGPGWFEVCLIPVTLAKTTLREWQPGRSVNLEPEYLARLVDAAVSRRLASGSP